MLGDREGYAEQHSPLRNRDVPGSFDDGEALVHQEPVAGFAGGRRVVALGAVVQHEENDRGAAIGKVEDDPMISLREIDRPQDLEIGGIADGAVGVLRRGEIDIGDDRVGWIAGIDRAGDRALNPLVLTD